MTDAYKQALVLRSDLDLSPGKAAAQASHVAVYATNRADDEVQQAWLDSSGMKVTLAAENESHIRELQKDADSRGLPTSVIADEGRTEIDPGTVTALAIGPAPPDEVDAVTGNLSLY